MNLKRGGDRCACEAASDPSLVSKTARSTPAACARVKSGEQPFLQRGLWLQNLALPLQLCPRGYPVFHVLLRHLVARLTESSGVVADPVTSGLAASDTASHCCFANRSHATALRGRFA